MNTKPFSFQVNTKKIKIKIKTKQYEKERGMVTGGSCGVVPMMCGDTWQFGDLPPLRRWQRLEFFLSSPSFFFFVLFLIYFLFWL
jgi:hypothetical protein